MPPPPPTSRCPHRLAALLGLLLLTPPALIHAGIFGAHDAVEEVCLFSIAPSCLIAAPDGDWLIGISQQESPRHRAMKVTPDGTATPFPTSAMSSAATGEHLPLDAVEALSVDRDGIAWILDNGRRNESAPKLIGWEVQKARLHKVVYLSGPSITSGSFCSDVSIDPSAPYAYIADPAHSHDAALIVVNLITGLSRRLLQGHPSVQPDPSVTFDPTTTTSLSIRRLDGSSTIPHCGVHSLALDRKGEWLYYAALQSNTVYRIHTRILRDASLTPAELAAAVDTYAPMPPSTSLAIDTRGNLYVSGLEGRTIGWISAKDRSYNGLVTDIRLVRPDGLTFGRDGQLYFFSPTRIETAHTETGVPQLTGYSLFRTKPPASGRAGD